MSLPATRNLDSSQILWIINSRKIVFIRPLFHGFNFKVILFLYWITQILSTEYILLFNPYLGRKFASCSTYGQWYQINTNDGAWIWSRCADNRYSTRISCEKAMNEKLTLQVCLWSKISFKLYQLTGKLEGFVSEQKRTLLLSFFSYRKNTGFIEKKLTDILLKQDKQKTSLSF